MTSQQTFLPPRSPSGRSVASTSVAAPKTDAPLGREQRAELTRQLERLHRRYFDLCETAEQRRDLRTLMHRTVEHLASQGIGWERLSHYFDFNRTMEDTRTALGGVGNATVFGVGGLLADLYAPAPLAAALDRAGVGAASRSAIMSSTIAGGVLLADGAASRSIREGMLGPGYVPSDSVRPAAPGAPRRFVSAFDGAVQQLPRQNVDSAIHQLNLSLGPYNTRNQALIGLTPTLEVMGVAPDRIAEATPYVQNLLGLAAGARGAMLVAADERASGHRSPLAYLYRQPVGGQEPLHALTTAIRRVEGQSLWKEQAKQIGTSVLGAAVAIPTSLVVPPVLAAERFGGVAWNDPRLGLTKKLVPKAVQQVFDPTTWVPAAAFAAGSAALGVLQSQIVGPAAKAATLALPPRPDQERSDRMFRAVAADTVTYFGKERIYSALTTAAVHTANQQQKLAKRIDGPSTAPGDDPPAASDGAQIHLLGASVLDLGPDERRSRTAPSGESVESSRRPRTSLGSLTSLGSSAAGLTPHRLDSFEMRSIGPGRSIDSRDADFTPRSPQSPGTGETSEASSRRGWKPMPGPRHTAIDLPDLGMTDSAASTDSR